MQRASCFFAFFFILSLLVNRAEGGVEEQKEEVSYRGPVHYSDGNPEEDIEGHSIEHLLNHGLANAAYPIIQEALTTNQSDAMHINLARAYVQMNRPHEGMKVLQSIAAKPQSEAYVEAHLLSGRLYMAMPDGTTFVWDTSPPSVFVFAPFFLLHILSVSFVRFTRKKNIRCSRKAL